MIELVNRTNLETCNFLQWLLLYLSIFHYLTLVKITVLFIYKSPSLELYSKANFSIIVQICMI